MLDGPAPVTVFPSWAWVPDIVGAVQNVTSPVEACMTTRIMNRPQGGTGDVDWADCTSVPIVDQKNVTVPSPLSCSTHEFWGSPTPGVHLLARIPPAHEGRVTSTRMSIVPVMSRPGASGQVA